MIAKREMARLRSRGEDLASPNAAKVLWDIKALLQVISEQRDQIKALQGLSFPILRILPREPFPLFTVLDHRDKICSARRTGMMALNYATS